MLIWLLPFNSVFWLCPYLPNCDCGDNGDRLFTQGAGVKQADCWAESEKIFTASRSAKVVSFLGEALVLWVPDILMRGMSVLATPSSNPDLET